MLNFIINFSYLNLDNKTKCGDKFCIDNNDTNLLTNDLQSNKS